MFWSGNFRRTILAPNASAAVGIHPVAALACAHRALAKEAHANAELWGQSALTAAWLDVWAHFHLAVLLAPIHGRGRAPIEAEVWWWRATAALRRHR